MTKEICSSRGQLCRLIQGEICRSCDDPLLSVGVSADDKSVHLPLAFLHHVEIELPSFSYRAHNPHITVVSCHISSCTIRVFVQRLAYHDSKPDIYS